MLKIILLRPFVFMLSCMNMPTPTSQITGAYTSQLAYDNFPTEKLSAEYNSLVRREKALVVAQEQRIKTSEVQAFWYGVGKGDGIEASELAVVRGELEAIRRVLEERDYFSEDSSE